jgi:D-glycero-alpha-D-manno-heptose-7-phosphate kinase
MIMTRTPFRVTLGGGGTDLPSYYSDHGGLIFGMGIDKHMYLIINPPTIDRKIRLHYTLSETADHVSDIRHELAREALRLNGIEDKMEISSMADLPAGTGLGSSSCYLIGLLNALHQYRRDHITLKQLAEEACHIELEVLRKPIGKQDQYMATFGGLTLLEIAKNGETTVSSVELGAGSRAALVANTHIYYTGIERNALAMLVAQDSAMKTPESAERTKVEDSLHSIKALGYRILDAIQNEDFDQWGVLLDEHWHHKKRMSDKISVSKVDSLYEHLKAEYSVLGGKIIGAGGGGFLMLYCPRDHKRLEAFMAANGMPRLHYGVQMGGSKVLADFDSGGSANFHPTVTVGAQVVAIARAARPKPVALDGDARRESTRAVVL